MNEKKNESDAAKKRGRPQKPAVLYEAITESHRLFCRYNGRLRSYEFEADIVEKDGRLEVTHIKVKASKKEMPLEKAVANLGQGKILNAIKREAIKKKLIGAKGQLWFCVAGL
jgi:hypothetical protein